MQVRFQFGAWHVEPHLNRLSSEEGERQVEPLAMDVLCCLLDRPGEVVTTDEILDKVWSDSHGEPSMVAKRINQIRRALNDSAKSPSYVETISKRGYRTIAPVTQVPDDAETADPRPAEEEEAGAQPRKRPGLLAAAALAAVVLAALGWFWGGFAGGTTDAPVRAIAVLPLENLSGDPSQEYVADGMTEELITELAKLSGLQVTSRTSIMRYKGARPSIQELVDDLGVDAIIEGTVTREAGRFRITVQLIDARTDSHLWADRFDSEETSVLRLRSDVAREVAAELKLNLTGDEELRLADDRQVDSAAYDAYLRGLAHRGMENDFDDWAPKAIEEFERALALDAGLAEARGWLAMIGLRRAVFDRDHFSEVRANAEAALAIDSSLGMAHAVLGFVRFMDDRDLDGAERAFSRARPLIENDPASLNLYQIYLRVCERFPEALEVSDRILKLAPRDVAKQAARINHFYELRLYERALEAAEQVRALVPAYVHGAESAVYHKLGRFQESYRARIAFYRSCGSRCAAVLEAAERGWAQGGYEEALRASVRPALALNDPEITPSTQVVETDEAFAWLESAVEDRKVWLVGLRADPDYDLLRLDPRFEELLNRLNLPARPESPARLADVGRLLAFRGRPGEAIERLERAIAQSPDDPRLSRWLESLAWAHFAAADYELAASWAGRVLERSVSAHAAAFAHLLQASGYSNLNRAHEAREALDKALQSWPGVIEVERDLRPLFLGSDAELRDRYIGGLQAAGLGG